MVSQNNTEFLWVEKYRPNTINECVLPDRIKKLASTFIEKGEISNMMFYGSGGVGKTTLAKAISNELSCDNIVINASIENGIDVLRTKITQFATSVSLDGKPKICILDESDGLNPNSVQPALRAFIEQFSRNCRFIFTCNFKEKLIAPLHSRLVPIDFTLTKEEKSKVIIQFFKRVCEILTLENVQYEKQIVAKVIEKHFPDFRRVLGELQKYSTETGGVIDNGLLSLTKDVEISDLIASFKQKDFKKMRSWVVANLDNDIQAIIRRLFDNLNETCQPHCIPNMILILADYSYKSAFVADQELNLVACFTEMMASGEWK